VKRRIATLVLGLGLTSTANAVEWSMDTTLRQALELSDNPFMRTVPAEALGSHSTVFGTITGQTKTSRFDFDGDFTYRKYWGEAANVDNTLSETTENGVRLRYETLGKVPGDREFAEASWRRRNTAFALLGDFGVPTNANGDIHTSTAIGGISRALTRTDLWTWTTRATSNNYDPVTAGIQYYDLATTNTFRHQSNSTSALTALSEFEWLKYDNTSQTSILIIRHMAGLDVSPLKNLKFVASAGAATVVTDQGASPMVTTPPASTPFKGVSTSFIGDATLTYNPLPTTELTLMAGQSIGPSIIGALTTRQYAAASLRYIINSQTSLTTRLDITRQDVSNAKTDYLTVATTLSQILARDWTLDLTYRYQHRSATTGTGNLTVDPITGVPIFLNSTGTGSASSNTLLFVLSRHLVVLPKRT
jgi:hypothetical protein